MLSAVSVEPRHELAVDLTGGFEFFGAPGEGLQGVGESLLELADVGGNVRVCGAADLGEDVVADHLAEAAAQGGEGGFEPTIACLCVFSRSARSEAAVTEARPRPRGVLAGDLRGPVHDLGAQLGWS
jgi:hypothetical protein